VRTKLSLGILELSRKEGRKKGVKGNRRNGGFITAHGQ
jgi:hypothetical protein